MNSSYGFRGMPTTNHGSVTGLPRIETHGLPADFAGGLRTAPPLGSFGFDFEMNGSEFGMDNGNTINPHALHMHGMLNFSMDGSFDMTQHIYSGIPNSQSGMDEDGFDWMAQGFEHQMTFAQANENAIDDSSPSVMSTNSPNGLQDATQNLNGVFVDNNANGIGTAWQPSVSNPQVVNSPMSMDVSSFFGDVAPPVTETISPKSLLAQKGANFDMSFSTPPELAAMDPSTVALMSGSAFTLPFKQDHIASTASTASVDSSLRPSSVTTNSSELVTDHMRNALIAGLSQNSAFGQHKQSQPTVSSPLSPSPNSKSRGFNAATFPSTQELQRYVSAYIKYFHPHLPFLHIATLNFESNEYAAARRLSNGYSQHTSSGAAGGSCLMLSVAAMGALFDDEMSHSRELFECAKRLISTYLEERRRQNVSKAHFPPYQRSEREDTPLWLVQAMLLNVIYGHNSGDKTAADIASNHCAALVSLARGAELAKPVPAYTNNDSTGDSTTHNAQTNGISPDGWNMLNIDTSDNDWFEWKSVEERKRTLYAVFILSSLLVTAYNRAPALTNSEIRLDLPCEEDLWAADSARTWRALGGTTTAESRSVQFATALTHLLTAAQRQRQAAAQQHMGEVWQGEEPELRPSSFGCLILINALHNYIWETRQRHLGRQWTPQEIESMHAHIEPALRAWQAAWNSNPTHAIERPNPFGAGPLSADSIPLLDLAYVRLFVDFGRSKEAYWQRDYDAMAQELAKGSGPAPGPNEQPQNDTQGSFSDGPPSVNSPEQQSQPNSGHLVDPSRSRPSQRERHLRKAAFYAADHLLASERLGIGLGEQNARELPMQSILCACDSAQVLAEWMATVQERVGRYIGVIGRDEIDFIQVPSILLLDDEDRKLLSMIDELLTSMESKRELMTTLPASHEGGYGSRILIGTSQTMSRAAVWPGKNSSSPSRPCFTNETSVTKLMARSLETQAGHVKDRAARSVTLG